MATLKKMENWFSSIAECSKGEHSAILLTCIEQPFVIRIFVLSIFECPFYTGFTVPQSLICKIFL